MSAEPLAGGDRRLHVDCARAAARAAGYLRHHCASGRWTDFLTRAGQSDAWTTAFVAYHLARGGLDLRQLEESAIYLLSQQREDGRWGYNKHVPADADTTAWCIRALQLIRPNADEALSTARDRLLDHRCEGGFSTYDDASAIRTYLGLPPDLSLDAWCGISHSDVTACITLALAPPPERNGSSIADPRRRQAYHHALDMVRDSQGADGRWAGYWWRTPMYPTTTAIEALGTSASSRDRKRVAKAVAWIADTQREEGSWDSGDGRGGAFVTGLAMVALAREPGRRAAWQRGAEWLGRAQRSDGSWDPSPTLRIPPPWVSSPDVVRRWKRGGLGVPVIVADQNRLFTTSVCFRALAGSVSREILQ